MIVDDHQVFLSAARSMLIAEGCDVVACASSGDEAMAMIATCPIDLVLVDLFMPGTDGVELAERFAAFETPPDVILISSWDDAEREPRVVSAPVRGFLAKQNLARSAIDRLLA